MAMANAELSVSDLMQFLPDFRELLDITEIAFSLLAKSVIRVDQSVGLTSGEKVERLMKLLQVLEISTSKPSGVYYFIVSLRETGERKNIKGHIDLLSKISRTFPTLDIEGCNDESCDDIASQNTTELAAAETAPVGRNLDYENRQGVITKDCDADVVLPPRTKPSRHRRHKLPKTPPASERHNSESESDPNLYEGVTPAKSREHTEKSTSALPPLPPPKPPPPSLPPHPVVPSSIPAKGPTKVDSDVDVYEAWPGATADNPSKSSDEYFDDEELYQDLPTAAENERCKVQEEYEEIDNWTTDKPPPLPSPPPRVHLPPPPPPDCDAKEDDYQELETFQSPSDDQKESFQSLVKQKENSDSNEEDQKYYHPTTDDEDDYPDDGDVNDSGKLTPKKLHDTPPRGSKSPASSTTSGGSEMHNGLLATAEMSTKDNNATEKSQDLSTSEMTVSELLQSITAERESIVKMAETQKAQLKSDLIKKHELEMKELHFKYKSKVKKLQLKQKEDGIAMKVVIEKLQSELTGVYKQNLKLTDYVKKSCKREERFNQIVTMLQGTVSSLESELTEVRQELDEVKRRENELLASLKVAKEKLKKYEVT